MDVVTETMVVFCGLVGWVLIVAVVMSVFGGDRRRRPRRRPF